MNAKRRSRALYWLRVTLGCAVLVVIAALAARAVDWRRTVNEIRGASAGWLMAAVAANAAIVFLWAGYWRRLTPRAQPVRYRRMLEIVSITSAVMNTVPFGAGHATGAVLLVKRGGMTRHGALNVVALDQLGEGVAKTMIYLLVAAVAPVPGWMHTGILLAASGAGLLLVLLLAVAHWYADHPEEPVPHAGGLVGHVREFVARWAKGLEVLRSWQRSGLALMWVMAMKLAEIAGIVLVQRASGVDVGAGGTLLVMAALVLGTMVPLSPGNVGTYEAAVFFAYRYLGVSGERALALALLQHACFMASAIGIGYATLLVGASTRGRLSSDPSPM